MISRHQVYNFLWIDLYNPNDSEVRQIADEYGLEYALTHELSSPTPRPRVRTYLSNKLLCAVFHIPAFKHSHASEQPQEIDFLIGRNLLITARYENIDALHTFEREIDVQNVLGKESHRYTHVFFHLMREIQECLSDELAHIEDWVSFIEESIFRGQQKKMVMDISEVGKNLLNFRKTIAPHREILFFLKENGESLFGKLFSKGIDELLKSWERLDQSAKDSLDMLLELRSTNDSILSTKQNEIMKTLTVLAFMSIPASVIAGIFNMSVELPLVNHPFAFWIILGGMVFFSLSMFIFFKIKKWL